MARLRLGSARARSDERDALAAAHHVLLSHGRAVEVLRAMVPGAEVGITLNLWPVDPASGTDADLDAARHADGLHNRWFLDPLYRGAYPEDMLAHHGDDAPTVRDGDMELIQAPTDFLGVNYVTENGAAYPDVRGHDGSVVDLERRLTSAATSTRSGARSSRAFPSTPTTSGRCSTTTSGPSATRSASGSSSSTTRPWSACRTRASARIAI